MKPFYLKGCCKDYIWGGNKLRAFGKRSDSDRIAESWELSCHPDGESVIASGEYAGTTLSAFLKDRPEAAGTLCERFSRFPAMVKLIDAHDDLSVQVHPDKTELWYVADAEEEAYILCGFQNGITRSEFREAIGDGTLPERMNRIPVRPGDVFMIPAGTLHAIGKGVLIAEVQQNSNITYRVCDYGRGRALHIAQALEVTCLEPTETIAARQQFPDQHPLQELGSCGSFRSARLAVCGCMELHEPESFLHLLMLEGEGGLETAEDTLALRKGDSVFVPADTECRIFGECTLIHTMTEARN